MRDELGIAHPIIDMDGHVVELFQATVPYLREALGPALFTRYIEREHALLYAGRTPAPLSERVRTRVPQRGWWTQHTKVTAERAIPMFPRMLYEQMASFGLDYAVLYPTNAFDDLQHRRTRSTARAVPWLQRLLRRGLRAVRLIA